MTTATQEPELDGDAADDDESADTPGESTSTPDTPTTSRQAASGQGEVEQIHHTLGRTLAVAGLLGTGITVAVLAHFIGAAALVAVPAAGGTIAAGVLAHHRTAKRRRERRGGGAMTRAARGNRRPATGRRGATTRTSPLGRSLRRAMSGAGGKGLGGPAGRKSTAGRKSRASKGGAGKGPTASRTTGLGGRARKATAGLGGRGSTARRSPVGRAVRGGILGGLLGNRAARRAAAHRGRGTSTSPGRSGATNSRRRNRGNAGQGNTGNRNNRNGRNNRAGGPTNRPRPTRRERFVDDLRRSAAGRAWQSWPVRWTRWGVVGVGVAAYGAGAAVFYGARASRRLRRAVADRLAAARPVLAARFRLRWWAATTAGWMRARLRRAAAWTRAWIDATRGNPMVGWLRRAVAGALHGLLLLWLFDRLTRWWRRRHPAPAPAAAHPATPINPVPATPAPAATNPPPRVPPVYSPRFPAPAKETPVTVLPMHQAVVELIDAAGQMGQTEFDNLADCRLFAASLPAICDHGAQAMDSAREFVMDHAATADAFDAAFGDFISQFQALGSGSDDVMTQLENWTGEAELPPVLHPAVMVVCDAWDALGAVQHADLNEARELCGSLHTVFRHLTTAIQNAADNITVHAPTAVGFAAEVEQYQTAMFACEENAQEATQHLEAWTEQPEVNA